MKLCGSWLVWLALAAAASSAAAQAPVLSTLEAPYPALQSQVTMAGSTYGAGAVAYGAVGTPLVLSGSGLGDNGAVRFVSYKNGVVDPNTAPVLAVVTLWSSNQIIFKTPSNAVSGLVEVVVGDKVSNGLPFIVTPGAYGATCPSTPPANQLQITTDSLQNATVNNSYSVQLSANGGSSPYTWSVVSGSLPPGLSLGSSGLLTGNPSSASGQTSFTVQAVDTGIPQQHDEATLSLQVEGASSTGLYSFSIQAAGGGAEGYDAVGNVTGYTDSVNGSWSFSYDSLNRLATATGSQAGNPYPDACWQYDNYGNRLWQTTAATAYTPSQNGGPNPCPAGSGPSSWAQYSTTNTNRIDASGLSFSYDAAGNVKSDGINSYLYDGEGRICAVQKSVSGLITNTQYLYDAEGRREAKGSISSFSCDTTANGFTATAVYVLGPDGEQLTEMAANRSGGWQWAHTNVFAPGLSATYDADLTGQSEGAMYFHLSDWLGTRRQQTDYVGNPVLNFTGLPYGDGLATFPVSNTDVSDATEHHFTGKERDAESGNDYFNARYLASSMGRFMSPDPANLSVDFWLPQTWNRYTYGLNNPLTMVDKNGLWPSPIHFLINDSSFPGMSRQDIGRLDKATWDMDWAPGQQDPSYAYQHGMQDGSGNVGGSPATMQELAQQDADNFISKQVATAQQAQADWQAQGHAGIAPAALTAFGNALHTVQDRTSPSHQGEQPWTGNAKDVPGHLWREKWPSSAQWTAAQNASRALFQRTFGDEFDWVFFKNPCARTGGIDSQGNWTGWSGCQ